MCIAIVNKHSMLTVDVFQNSFENNPDGAGIAYITNGKIKVIKEMKSYAILYQKYAEIRQSINTPIFLHFRIGTSGIKDERNVHPFLIDEEMALIHNGMISYNIMNKDYSDTWHFTELLKSLRKPENLLNSNSVEYQMFSAFTKGSKVALLHASGAFSILNESAGKWHDDTWYSNETYKACSYYNVGGKQISKSVYTGYNAESYTMLSKWHYDTLYLGYKDADLKQWNLNLIDSDELEDFLPYSKQDFTKMKFADKVILMLSIGDAVYGLNHAETYLEAIRRLEMFTGKSAYADIYDAMHNDYLYILTYNNDELQGKL